MNCSLSVYADRVNGKVGYVIMSDGRIVSEKIGRFKGNNIKENVLQYVFLGLKDCRSRVHHEDILTVGVQNIHLYQWLNGMMEYKDYSTYLDKVFGVLELLDCKYRFYFSKNLYMKSYIQDRDLTGIKVSTVDDMMRDFE